MEQASRRLFLIQKLIRESPQWRDLEVPEEEGEQRYLLRALMNVRPPAPMGEDFLEVQDAYLQEETRQKGITDCGEIPYAEPGIRLWKGDITTLRCGAIVNAANSGMTGCYVPCHSCIDNCIHTYAGVQLRLACQELMTRQGHEEPVGQAKLTPAYNLPCQYVLHTVGPMIQDRVTQEDCALLVSCYRSCLELAQAHSIPSVAFCCISTGVFRFPNQLAAEIAVDTVRRYRNETEVIFNVFQDSDFHIYRRLVG